MLQYWAVPSHWIPRTSSNLYSPAPAAQGKGWQYIPDLLTGFSCFLKHLPKPTCFNSIIQGMLRIHLPLKKKHVLVQESIASMRWSEMNEHSDCLSTWISPRLPAFSAIQSSPQSHWHVSEQSFWPEKPFFPCVNLSPFEWAGSVCLWPDACPSCSTEEPDSRHYGGWCQGSLSLWQQHYSQAGVCSSLC